MKKNRLMTLALITALAISAFPSNAVKLNESSADAELDFEIPESRVNGYRMVPVPERDKYRSMADDPDYDPDRALSGPDDLDAVSLSEAEEALPESFPASYNDDGLDGVLEALNERLPQTRNQGNYGLCWSFATTAALEGNLINKYGYDPNTTDLSELHTGYYGMHYSLDNGNGNCDITEYDTTCYPGNIPYYEAGNDAILASDFLSNRTGAVNETDMPYSGIEDTLKGKLDAPQDRCLVTVKGWQLFLSRDESQWPMIKAAIKENGAVMSSMPALTKSEQINLETDSYYTDQVSPNHAIAIVGWDDDYSYKNFRLEENGGTISENGAWIIRNSWRDGAEMHPYSYFYMSYYTPCFLDKFINVVSLSACPLGDDYDNIYQYDGMVSSIEGVISDSSNRLLASNVFTARGREDLKAVSFKTDLDVCNMNYTVDVYTGLKEGYDSPIPEGAAPVATAKGKTTVPGLYRVNLDNAVELEAGDIYSVVVTVTKTDDVVGIGAETKDSTVDWYVNKNMAVSPGQSFLYDNDTGEWIDMGDGYKAVYHDQEMTFGNLRIKAFTDTVAVAPTKLSISAGKPLNLEPGMKEKFTATVTPEDAAGQVYFISSNPRVASVSQNGAECYITGGVTGSCKVTAVSGHLKKTVNIKVENSDKSYTKMNWEELGHDTLYPGEIYELTTSIGGTSFGISGSGANYNRKTGVLKITKAGTPIISVYSSGNGNATVNQKELNIRQPLTEFKLSKSSIKCAAPKSGKTGRVTIKANVNPGIKKFTGSLTWTAEGCDWLSLDTSKTNGTQGVFTVSDSATSESIGYITAVATDSLTGNEYKTRCMVTVK